MLNLLLQAKTAKDKYDVQLKSNLLKRKEELQAQIEAGGQGAGEGEEVAAAEEELGRVEEEVKMLEGRREELNKRLEAMNKEVRLGGRCIVA